MSKILFYSSVHRSFDDRTYYHQAIALEELGHEVYIFSEIENLDFSENNIKIISRDISNLNVIQKRIEIKNVLSSTNPDIIVCDYPVSVLLIKSCVKNKKTRIVYDITEWVPSKKNLQNVVFPFNIIKFLILLITNLLAGSFANRLIFGEYHKSLLFKTFSSKKQQVISYFPDSKYIKSTEATPLNESLTLFYSGWFNFEKGFDKVLQLTSKTATLNPTKKIHLDIVGDYPTENDKVYFEEELKQLPENVTVSTTNFLDFNDFCKHITTVDIFLDLRKNDFENTRCLPIKLFYYMACGRPVVYSDLKAIKHLLDIEEFGYYFDGNNIDVLAKMISEYFKETELYLVHSTNAKELFQETYQWNLIKNDFVKFIVD